MRRLLLPLLFALGLHAQDAASVARMVNAPAVDTAALEKALQSSDALIRATAARVALVRNATALVPSLRTQLGSESNAEAARELVRAIAILGANEDVTFAASQLARFPATIDAAFADALARRPGGDAGSFPERLRATPLPVMSTSRGNGPPRQIKGVAMPVREPEFALLLVLPRGLGSAVLRATRCKAGWIGVADVARDAAGRVQSVGTKGVQADRGCTEALRTIARLSLAEPGAPVETSMLVMRAEGAPPCFDEAPVSNSVPVTTGPEGIKAPKVLRRAEPYYPDSVRRQTAGGVFSVVAEAVITSEGCVRDLRLVQQTIHPELNRAALEALSKWTFAPGTLDGTPVDVLFNLTITFRH